LLSVYVFTSRQAKQCSDNSRHLPKHCFISLPATRPTGHTHGFQG
jgi:hypothetical protein